MNAKLLQHEVYTRMTEGESDQAITESLKQRKLDLRKMMGNPSDKEIKGQIDQVVSGIRKEIKSSENLGDAFARALELEMRCTKLAGDIMETISITKVDTIPDSQALQTAYKGLQQSSTENALKKGLEFLEGQSILVDDLSREFTSLFPVKEEESGEEAAEA